MVVLTPRLLQQALGLGQSCVNLSNFRISTLLFIRSRKKIEGIPLCFYLRLPHMHARTYARPPPFLTREQCFSFTRKRVDVLLIPHNPQELIAPLLACPRLTELNMHTAQSTEDCGFLWTHFPRRRFQDRKGQRSQNVLVVCSMNIESTNI